MLFIQYMGNIALQPGARKDPSRGRKIQGPKDASSKCAFQRVVNGQENQEFTEARQRGMFNLFF